MDQYRTFFFPPIPGPPERSLRISHQITPFIACDETMVIASPKYVQRYGPCVIAGCSRFLPDSCQDSSAAPAPGGQCRTVRDLAIVPCCIHLIWSDLIIQYVGLPNSCASRDSLALGSKEILSSVLMDATGYLQQEEKLGFDCCRFAQITSMFQRKPQICPRRNLILLPSQWVPVPTDSSFFFRHPCATQSYGCRSVSYANLLDGSGFRARRAGAADSTCSPGSSRRVGN